MQTIKYKVWHKSKKTMSKPYTVSNGKKGALFFPHTTLKDNKGNEIYEYDIIKIAKDVGNVKAGYYIVANHQGCYMITRDSHLNYMEHYLWFVTDHCEVVKNFFIHKDSWQSLQVKMAVKSPFALL